MGYGRLNANQALKYVIEHFGATVPAGETMTLSNDTFNMEPGVQIVADGTLTIDNATFQRAQPTQSWDGILINGVGSIVKNSTIDGATVGVEVAALNVTIDNTTLSNNTIGVLTDYHTSCPACFNGRSTLTLKNSDITNSASTGLYARHADIAVENTTVTGSIYSGILVEDADLYPFTNNTITGNGVIKGHGISVISAGDLTMGPNAGYGGYNVVRNNSNHELSVTTGGTLLVGTAAAGGDNSVYKSGGNPAPIARYIYNGAGLYPTVMARYTWWGDENGPPAGAFTGSVDAQPFLVCDPLDPPNCPPLRSGSSSSAKYGSGESSPRGGDWAAWLRGEILAARQVLNDTPAAEGMAGVVHRLAHLQRLDREDELGEHTATWALLRALRQRLNGHPPEAIREVAVAALVSEVRAGLYEQNYDAARDLLAQYASEVMDEESRLVLDLAVVSLLEQAGDYASALAKITTIIAALPPEASDLARELGLAASVIEARAEQQAGGRMPAPVSTVVSALGETVTTYALEAAYPNPFNPNVTVPFAVPEAAQVEVVLYDVLGRRVAVLANSLFDIGRHTVRFDGSNLASGVYVLRAVMEAETGGSIRTFTQRLTLLK